MKFEKTRVYTALNAEELPIGSVCIYADALRELRKRVQTDSSEYKQVLTGLHDDSYTARFMTAEYFYALAYLIEPPAKQKYKPFESVKEAMEAIKKHGGWIKQKNSGMQFIVYAKDIGLIRIADGWYTMQELFERFVFADDGSPCGELVEE